MAFSSKPRGKGAITPLEQLIEEINFQRAKEMRQILKDGKFKDSEAQKTVLH